MTQFKLLNEKEINKLNEASAEKLFNEHNGIYVDFCADNPNLEDAEYDANRYYNDTLTKKQAKWLDDWSDKYEQLQDICDELYRASFLVSK